MGRKKIEIKDTTSKKDDLDPSKDEFVQKSMSFLDWAVERRKQIGVIFGLILVGWVGFIIYGDMKESKIQDASKILADGLEASIAPVVTDVPAGDIDDKVLTFSSEEKRAKEAISRLDKAVKQTAGTPVAAAAKLAKASALAESGDVGGAIKLYQDCLKDSSLIVFKESILSALALAYENNGDDDQAQKTYQQLLDSSTGRISLWAKLGIASIFHRKGEELKKAENLLQGIVDEISATTQISNTDYLFVTARTHLLALNPQAKVQDAPAGINPQLLQQLMQGQQAGGAAQ